MKRNIAWTMFFICMFLVNLTATAGDDFTCSPANAAGTWGYIETATIFDATTTPPTRYPYASVGIYTLDARGNMSGKRTASLAGTTLRATIVGTATVNPDCTGTENLSFYDESGNLTGTATKALVYVNKGKEVNKIITAPSGLIVAITKAKRVLPGRQDLLDLDRNGNGKRAFGCSSADLEGEWGTTMTGTILTPAGAVTFGALNKAFYDSEGNFGGTQIRSINGATSTANFEGEYMVNPDFTGTKIVRTYDLSGKLLNTAYQDFVLVDNANEIFEIFTSNIRADGVALPMIVTGQSHKTFPKGAQALD
ncbi:MAG TPA: hypothetical protein VLL97_13780 [Acidobacteriota bacterium]|nr:hypothetical protein [Acidobacteriota bacterium]